MGLGVFPWGVGLLLRRPCVVRPTFAWGLLALLLCWGACVFAGPTSRVALLVWPGFCRGSRPQLGALRLFGLPTGAL